ncbi:phospho-N-acetylmuramoyl-pentapeptide-transferase [Candidatus Sumerlaeota bacterium]|nr:phospho-N-acetylmuramoyl-pentapeptide-transferase [Candidatus Sumerlaeota bacterium]
MIYYLFAHIQSSGLLRVNPVQYETVRAGFALFTAFFLSVIFGRYVIAILKALKAGQPIRTASAAGAIDLNAMHGSKAGTPTMGGILIVGTIVITTLLFCNLSNIYVWLLIIATLGFAALGFIDDYRKVTKHNANGISPMAKIAGQVALGLIVGCVLYLTAKCDPSAAVYSYRDGANTCGPFYGFDHIMVPFFKTFYPCLGIVYIAYVIFVLTGTSNAVNLTDGLDGLCIGTMSIVAMAFIILAYVAGSQPLSAYLMVPYIKGAPEVVVFMGALIGACLGFLWYNAHPANMFMGDTGSLALGGAIGTVALICKQEILLTVIGGIFVIEALSVIIQVTSYKLRGKRVFLMSPIHHHFEKKNWHESKIIARFWIISILFALIGLCSLKLR